MFAFLGVLICVWFGIRFSKWIFSIVDNEKNKKFKEKYYMEKAKADLLEKVLDKESK